MEGHTYSLPLTTLSMEILDDRDDDRVRVLTCQADSFSLLSSMCVSAGRATFTSSLTCLVDLAFGRLGAREDSMLEKYRSTLCNVGLFFPSSYLIFCRSGRR